MMLTWIGYAMLCSAALGALAVCVEYALGHRRYPRRVLWLGVMLASAGVPIGASLLAKPPAAARIVVAPAADAGPRVETRRGVDVDPDRVVQGAWAIASLCAAFWFGVLQLRLTRRLRRCSHAQVAGTRALVSPDFGPAVVGVFHPEIVLPEWALALDDGDRRLVLTHETEHTRAYDPALHFVGLAIAVLFPWNAGLWWQLKRLRLAIEIDCDTRVVDRHGNDPIRYGELLVAAHTHAVRPIVAALALVQRRSALGRRIDALVALPRHSAGRVCAAAGVGFGLLAAVAFSPAPSLRAPIVVARSTSNQADTARTRATLPRDSNRTVIAVARRPRSAPAGRMSATITAQPLPPVRLTPTRFDAQVTTVAAPTSAAALPPSRIGGGRGRMGGVVMARPTSAVFTGPPPRADTAAGRGGVARVIRRDTIIPPR